VILLQILVGGLLLGAVYSLLASGLTLIWGMMNVVNFAHGEFIMLGMYVAFWVFALLGGGPVGFTIAAAVALFILGALTYLVLIRHVMKGPILAQILSTFGLMLFLRYLAVWAFTANFRTLPDNVIGGSVNVGGIHVSMPQLVAGLAAFALTVCLHLLLTRTRVGSQMLAVSEDAGAAMLMGIRPDRMQALAWGLAGASAAVAGALLATFFPISPMVAESLVLIAFVVVALGGFGSVPGTLLSGLLIGLIESLSAYYIAPNYKDVVVFALFVVILWVRPQGLLGKAEG
jgi:branched-chain amino acid transport system permease protein